MYSLTRIVLSSGDHKQASKHFSSSPSTHFPKIGWLHVHVWSAKRNKTQDSRFRTQDFVSCES